MTDLTLSDWQLLMIEREVNPISESYFFFCASLDLGVLINTVKKNKTKKKPFRWEFIYFLYIIVTLV